MTIINNYKISIIKRCMIQDIEDIEDFTVN